MGNPMYAAGRGGVCACVVVSVRASHFCGGNPSLPFLTHSPLLSLKWPRSRVHMPPHSNFDKSLAWLHSVGEV